MTFSTFDTVLTPSRYVQYRTVLESDDAGTGCNYGAGATWCSPELKSAAVGPVHYDRGAPTIVGQTGVQFSSVTSMAEALGASCASGVTYNLGVGATSGTATWYYWNGAAWVAANGTVAQSTTAANIAANAAGFAAVAGTGKVYFKAFLRSTGLVPCELSEVGLDGIY
jgi:hypothetical protein